MESGKNPLWAGIGYPHLFGRKSALTPNPVGVKNESIVENGCISFLEAPHSKDDQAQILVCQKTAELQSPHGLEVRAVVN